MAGEQTPMTPDGETPREVDRIRDILFGSQMRDYQQRFQQMHRDLERLQQEIASLGEQLSTQDGEQNRKLQNLRRESKQADEDLRGELRQTAESLMNEKVDRNMLGELFVELGNHLKTGSSLTDLLAGLNEGQQHDARADQG